MDVWHKPFWQSNVPLRQNVLSNLKYFLSFSGQIDDAPEHGIASLHSLSARHTWPDECSWHDDWQLEPVA